MTLVLDAEAPGRPLVSFWYASKRASVPEPLTAIGLAGSSNRLPWRDRANCAAMGSAGDVWCMGDPGAGEPDKEDPGLRVRMSEAMGSSRDNIGVDVDAGTLQSNKYENVFSLGDSSSLPTSKVSFITCEEEIFDWTAWYRELDAE